jgi:hypothetical protein
MLPVTFVSRRLEQDASIAFDDDKKYFASRSRFTVSEEHSTKESDNSIKGTLRELKRQSY